MRVVVVSAHYPPDFVSGGTLVPERLARGLRARGHQVSVYAGNLDPTRPALSTWRDTDETGLPVRWVSVHPFLGWSDTRNYDNPEVEADFAAHLAEVRPDVVHLHSLQSLGAGLVAVAKAAGARVVVTMHDFWWVCARQFLVERTLRPCSPVVAAGLCPCEVDHAWLLHRNDALAGLLAEADAVLVPSESARAVAAANGLAPERLHVDENGLVAPPARARPAARSSGPLRFVYTGGPDPLKGSGVILDAATRLRGVPGWSLDAYGLADGAATSVAGLPVRSHPPYRPGDLDRVLGAADVLVVPSLMRESHSLVTREALLRGLAVVATDTLGPEEVVEHGRNGLVVPTGDGVTLGADLAAAMRRLVEQPAEVARMRAAPAPATRSVEDHVAATEGLYAELCRPAPAPAARRPSLARVLFVCGITGAPLRYRARLAAEGLGLVGVASDVRHYRDPDVPALAAAADAVVLYRVPATDQVLGLAAAVRSRPEPVPLIFDVDDLIFDPDIAAEIPALRILPADESRLWLQGVRRYRTTMESCDLFVTSTAPLARHAAAVTALPVRLWENGVGLLLARRSDAALRRPRSPGPLRIGYLSGTTTHDRDWAHVEPAVLEVLRSRPDVELVLGGYLRPTAALDELGGRVRRLPMQDWRVLPETLRDLDVNLAPLEDTGRFNEAKSAIKWLEAALVATPTVASPSEPFRRAVEHGRNGLLAATPQEWAAALGALLDDAGERHRLGHRARRDVLLGLAPHLQGQRYLRILEDARDLVARGRPERTSRWRPVALDEPWEPQPLDPYDDDLAVGPGPEGPPEAPTPPVGWAGRIRAARRLHRERGAGALVATTTVWLLRRVARQLAGELAPRLPPAVRRVLGRALRWVLRRVLRPMLARVRSRRREG